jgi:ferritin-like metal-binding protein YciE
MFPRRIKNGNKSWITKSFVAALKDLIELDFDATEAYAAAIDRVESAEYRSKLSDFKKDHERHIEDLSKILETHSEKPPTAASIKRWLTEGKVVLGGFVGDHFILSAMRSNEVDTNAAYERLNAYEDKWPDAVEALAKGLADEKRHKEWFEATIAHENREKSP